MISFELARTLGSSIRLTGVSGSDPGPAHLAPAAVRLAAAQGLRSSGLESVAQRGASAEERRLTRIAPVRGLSTFAKT